MIDWFRSYTFLVYQFSRPSIPQIRLFMEMVGSRATCSSIAREATLIFIVVASTTVNQPNAIPRPREVDCHVDAPPRTYLSLPPPRVRIVQVPSLGVLTPLSLNNLRYHKVSASSRRILRVQTNLSMTSTTLFSNKTPKKLRKYSFNLRKVSTTLNLKQIHFKKTHAEEITPIGRSSPQRRGTKYKNWKTTLKRKT